jgi:hypothetical protein
VKDHSLKAIVINGHGMGAATGGDLNGNNLTKAQAAEINRVLAPDGKVIFSGCDAASGDTDQQCQDLADKIGHPVIANTAHVGGMVGQGDWIQYDPTTPAKSTGENDAPEIPQPVGPIQIVPLRR